MKAFTGFENVFGAYYGTAAEIARRTANATRAGVVLWPAFALAQITQDSYGAFFTSGVKNPVGLAIEILKEMETAGFKLKENIDNLPWQHCMIFVKK